MMTDEGRWYFRALHFGQHDPNASIVLWLAVFPDARLHVIHELRRQDTTIAALTRDVQTETRRLSLPREQIRYTCADEANIGKEVLPDGESRADTFRHSGLSLRVLQVDPLQGWTRVKELLGLRPLDHQPWLTISPTCPYLIRALTTAVKADTNPDAVSEFANVQPILALRTAVMSRPAPKPYDKAPFPKGAVGHLVNDLRNPAPSTSIRWR